MAAFMKFNGYVSYSPTSYSSFTKAQRAIDKTTAKKITFIKILFKIRRIEKKSLLAGD